MTSAWKGLKSGWTWDGRSISYSDPDRSFDYEFNYAELGALRRLRPAERAAARVGAAGARPRRRRAGRPGAASRSRGSPGSPCATRRRAAASATSGSATPATPTAYAYLPGRRRGRRRLARPVGRATAGRQLRPHDGAARDRPRARARSTRTRAGRFGAVPRRAFDTPEFTVMTYRAWEGAAPDGYALRALGGAADLDDARHRGAAGALRRGLRGQRRRHRLPLEAGLGAHLGRRRGRARPRRRGDLRDDLGRRRPRPLRPLRLSAATCGSTCGRASIRSSTATSSPTSAADRTAAMPAAASSTRCSTATTGGR